MPALKLNRRGRITWLYSAHNPGVKAGIAWYGRLTGDTAAKASKFIVYPDAPHAFHADYRPSYREAAARDGWTQALDWFARHLK